VLSDFRWEKDFSFVMMNLVSLENLAPQANPPEMIFVRENAPFS